jgi:hypothetical protein
VANVCVCTRVVSGMICGRCMCVYSVGIWDDMGQMCVYLGGVWDMYLGGAWDEMWQMYMFVPQSDQGRRMCCMCCG